MEEIPFDSSRRLCPDGSCVGVLNADGRCSVCGQQAGAAVATVDAVVAAGGVAEADLEAADSEADPISPASNFDAGRRLCDDGSCVGVVGADGACGTCGRKAE
jgi:hypothetical protein